MINATLDEKLENRNMYPGFIWLDVSTYMGVENENFSRKATWLQSRCSELNLLLGRTSVTFYKQIVMHVDVVGL